MNKGRLIILICVVIVFCWFAGCTTDIAPDDGTENNGGTEKGEVIMPTMEITSDNATESNGNHKKEKTPIDYADLYRNEEVKSPILTGEQRYKASDGYIQIYEQGYNGFYYEYAQGNAYNQMTLQEQVWKGGDTILSGGVMTSSANTQAVRAFQTPAAGNVVVSGNPYLLSGDGAKVQILLDNTVLWQADVSDDIGIWHELDVQVSAEQTIRFIVDGNASVYWNSTIDYTNQAEIMLHSEGDGFYGDVHPFYDEKNHRMYMFYLSTGLQKGIKTELYNSMLSISDNMIIYRPQSIERDSANPPKQKLYYVLNVIKDKNGNYRSAFGVSGSSTGTSLSKDLLTWQNGMGERYTDENGAFTHTWKIISDCDYGAGDPDIFYNADDGMYYSLIINYYSTSGREGPKGLALYTAGEDGKFSTKAAKLLDFTGRGVPECPQLKKIGDRWYLFYSVVGTGTAGGVGLLSYRIGDAGMAPQDVDWNAKTEYALDGGDVHAAQLCEVGDKYYMYGWINYQPHSNVWGGYLNLPREVYQQSDGSLKSRLDPYLSKLLNKGFITAFQEDNVSLDGLTVDGTTVTAKASGTAMLNGSYQRNFITTRLTLPDQGEYAIISVKQGKRTYCVGVVRQAGKLYLAVTPNPANPFGHIWIEILDNSITTFDMQVTIDGPFIEAFVNGEYSLTAHIPFSKDGGHYSLGLSLSGTDTVADNTRIYKLASLQNIFD